MSTKTKVVISSIALLVAFASGRYLTPKRIEIQTKTVTIETKQDTKVTDDQKHIKTKKTETTKPDGTKTVVTVVTNDSDTKSTNRSVDNTKSDSESSKVTINYSSRLTLSAMAGIPLSPSATGTPVFGGQLYKEVLGPIGIGAWYLSNNTTGMIVGVSF